MTRPSISRTNSYTTYARHFLLGFRGISRLEAYLSRKVGCNSLHTSSVTEQLGALSNLAVQGPTEAADTSRKLFQISEISCLCLQIIFKANPAHQNVRGFREVLHMKGRWHKKYIGNDG